jgi:predicted nuclease of restriction endonuclease-like (RecB) superfamily
MCLPHSSEQFISHQANSVLVRQCLTNTSCVENERFFPFIPLSIKGIAYFCRQININHFLTMSELINNKNYNDILRYIVAEIKSARRIIANRINSSTMQSYWNIGRRLSEEGLAKGYGSQVVERLSIDLKEEFPDTTGFSPRNLWDMKRLYEFYSQGETKLPQAVAVFPWGHHRLLLSKIKDRDEALYYIEAAVEMGWTHVLLNFIKADTYKNTKLLPKHHNFAATLPEHLQEQADEMLKSSYNLDFIGLLQPLKEKELERRLVENPSIGIILCADKDRVDIEVALRDINKPIGVAEYKLQFPEKELKQLISEELANEIE